MGKIKHISLSILILCCFYPNISSAQNQNTEKKKHYGWGGSWKFGYSQFMAINDFSQYLKGGAGIQTEIDILYKRFEFCASTGTSFTKARNDFTLNNNTVNVNDKVEAGMVGFSISYAILYTDYLKISPLAGTVWNSLRKDENIHTKNIFTGTVGFQIECSFVTSSGGLTSGLCLPLYLKSLPTDKIYKSQFLIFTSLILSALCFKKLKLKNLPPSKKGQLHSRRALVFALGAFLVGASAFGYHPHQV